MSGTRQNIGKDSVARTRDPGRRSRENLRALGEDEKELRRQDILDAADKLYAEHHDMANMADVAESAGLAKGTVYLYFQSKEELYLALHLRHAERFFTQLIARLNLEHAFGFGEMQALAGEHILDDPTYLPLGACCIGFAAGTLRPEVSAHFQQRLAEWLKVAGDGLERHFTKLARGEGARLLKHSYAIMIGLHSLHRRGHGGCPEFEGQRSFQEEASLALTRYWVQVAGIDVAAVATKTPPHTEGETI